MTAAKPFGHAVYILRRKALPVKGPFDEPFRDELIQIRRRGGRKALERACRLTRGFIRLASEIEPYTAQEWVRAFGTGNERGTEYGRVNL